MEIEKMNEQQIPKKVKTVQTIAVSPVISARIVVKDTQSSQILSLRAVPIPWMKLSMPSMRF